jgi:hypothetical protein
VVSAPRSLLTELARLNDRTLDAGRGRRAADKSTGTAIVRVGTAREQTSKPGDALARPRQQDDDERAADERVLSLRLEIVDARTQRAPDASADARPAREVERPAPKPTPVSRPSELALGWPDAPPSAAARQGTPAAYRAIAAYDAQVQLQNQFRHPDDEPQRIRLRA